MRIYGECKKCHKNFEKVDLAPGIYKCKFVEVSEPIIKKGHITHSVTRIEITNGICKDCAEK